MAQLPPWPGSTGRRDWKTAIGAVRTLMAHPDDTTQVFRIMRALNVGQGPRNHARLLTTFEGGKLIYASEELAQKFSQPGYVAAFAPGTVGAAYRDFLKGTGYSADGLVEVSRLEPTEDDIRHPYAWFGRRVRDTHDIWHTLTGYKADEVLGEGCLVAFSYAQVGGLGWAFIGFVASLKSLTQTRSPAFARAVWEGYQRGRRTKWLPIQDYDALLNEPLEAARARLNMGEPVRYREAQAFIADYVARRPMTAQTA